MLSGFLCGFKRPWQRWHGWQIYFANYNTFSAFFKLSAPCARSVPCFFANFNLNTDFLQALG